MPLLTTLEQKSNGIPSQLAAGFGLSAIDLTVQPKYGPAPATAARVSGDLLARSVGSASIGFPTAAIKVAGVLFVGEVAEAMRLAPVVPPAVPVLSGDLESRRAYVDKLTPTVEHNARLGYAGLIQTSAFWDYGSGPRLFPPLVALDTLVSDVYIDFYIYNWTDSPVVVNSLTIYGDSGIEIVSDSLPYSIDPKKRLKFTAIVHLNGASDVDASLEAICSSPSVRLVSYISGSRFTPIVDIPESPIEETWEWLTDTIRAVDGSEQRFAVRGKMPRISQNMKYILQTLPGIRKLQLTLLTSRGKIWMPEFQYAIRLNGASAKGTDRIYFDVSKIDVRENERLMMFNDKFVTLATIKSIEADGAKVVSALNMDVDDSFTLVTGSAALLDDGFGLSRKVVHNNAEFKMNGKFQRIRSQLSNPAVTVTFPTYSSRPVLEKVPMADEDLSDGIITGNEVFDNTTGIFDAVSLWNQSKVTTAVKFKLNRLNSAVDLNFWKAFFDLVAGGARQFWMPTFRPDLQIVSVTSFNTIRVDGTDYAETLFQMPNYRYLRIDSSAGILYTKVTAAISISGGMSELTITPDFYPNASVTVNSICFMRPVRLADDQVSLKHYNQETELSFAVIDVD